MDITVQVQVTLQVMQQTSAGIVVTAQLFEAAEEALDSAWLSTKVQHPYL